MPARLNTSSRSFRRQHVNDPPSERLSSQRSVWSKMSSFMILYFLQGLPYGLQGRFLPLYLRTHGKSLSNISFYKLLLIPWVFKFVWAPSVDSMGSNKQVWLRRSLLSLAALCLIATQINPDREIPLSVILFIINLIVAVQDIVVDGLLIQCALESELVLGNTIQVVAYKAGNMFTGGVYMWFIATLTWNMIFISLALLYVIGYLACLMFIDATTPQNSSENLSDASSAHLTEGILDKIVRYYQRIFNTRGTSWMVKYVLLYKLGDTGVANLFPLFLVDAQVQAATVGFWTGFVGSVLSMAGSSFGALIFGDRSMKRALQIYLCLICFTQCAIMFFVSYWDGSVWMFSGSILMYELQNFFSGAVTTCTFTLAMQLSQTAPQRYQASHWSLLATMEVLGKLVFASCVGPVADFSGYSFSFILFFVLSLLVLLQMLFGDTQV